jgi:hypothetical protein
MVIDQGTLLDRIDFNVEQASVHLQDAVYELDEVFISFCRIVSQRSQCRIFSAHRHITHPKIFFFPSDRARNTRRRPGTARSFYFLFY